jgi:hypothetical protein
VRDAGGEEPDRREPIRDDELLLHADPLGDVAADEEARRYAVEDDRLRGRQLEHQEVAGARLQHDLAERTNAGLIHGPEHALPNDGLRGICDEVEQPKMRDVIHLVPIAVTNARFAHKNRFDACTTTKSGKWSRTLRSSSRAAWSASMLSATSRS